MAKEDRQDEGEEGMDQGDKEDENADGGLIRLGNLVEEKAFQDQNDHENDETR